MKVTVDQQLCVGNGLCEAAAPDLFAVGDDGMAQVLVDEIPAADQELADEAVAACPARALIAHR
ncbi:ferredoxin [Mycolicibacterium confluentis]|uniref:Ferredoxin n=2 Tax=Mycolicibacterium confluentis TaxID=28047 RepID=A0A7I7Y097_9MYCO|nr:ferredoxin [Mycolicibacterium confluentis]ORV34904.1 ferredoxin [Mycolicibacterium confluentis]BBZ35065.1 ferredoxin [Mycolicibacterium confluentis]